MNVWLVGPISVSVSLIGIAIVLPRWRSFLSGGRVHQTLGPFQLCTNDGTTSSCQSRNPVMPTNAVEWLSVCAVAFAGLIALAALEWPSLVILACASLCLFGTIIVYVLAVVPQENNTGMFDSSRAGLSLWLLLVAGSVLALVGLFDPDSSRGK